MCGRWLSAALAAIFLCTVPAHAVIQRAIPLKDVLNGKTFVVVARVEQLDPAKATMVLTIGEVLKGEFPHRRLTVDLRGDALAQKEKQSPQLLERLAPNLEVIVFGMTMPAQTAIHAFTNGTWFTL